MNDDEFHSILGSILKIGVFVSIGIVVVGTIIIMATGRADGYTLTQLSNISTTDTSQQLNSAMLPPSGILHGLFDLDGAYYIVLGLWVLVFTPITVLVVSIFQFIFIKNTKYAVISIIVLINLFIAMVIIR